MESTHASTENVEIKYFSFVQLQLRLYYFANHSAFFFKFFLENNLE